MSNVETTFLNSRVEKTYKIVERSGIKGIKCLQCGRISYHPIDVQMKYCANCKTFHNEVFRR